MQEVYVLNALSTSKTDGLPMVCHAGTSPISCGVWESFLFDLAFSYMYPCSQGPHRPTRAPRSSPGKQTPNQLMWHIDNRFVYATISTSQQQNRQLLPLYKV
jgi:hypothetical protein